MTEKNFHVSIKIESFFWSAKVNVTTKSALKRFKDINIT